MGYVPDATIAAFQGEYNLGLFFRLETAPALRLWWGVSDIPAEIAGLDIGGTIYNGGGFLTTIPDALEVMLNGTSDRIDWALNGIDPKDTANLDADAPNVIGALASFAVAPLDLRWQLLAQPLEIWNGIGDCWAESQPFEPDRTKSKTRTLTLSTITGDSSRALPFYATWTDPIQKRLSATDRFCERVARYYQAQIIRWPHF